MKKIRKNFNFLLPCDVDGWMNKHVKNKTEFIVEAIELYSKINREKLKSFADQFGIEPHRIIEIALSHFGKLADSERAEAISSFFKSFAKPE